MWIVPDRERAIIPKNNGLGVMVSAFQSIDTGFELEISDAMMKLFNERSARKYYFDKVAAQDVHNTTEKSPLVEYPFFKWGIEWVLVWKPHRCAN